MVSFECSATLGSQKLGSADQTQVPMVYTDGPCMYSIVHWLWSGDLEEFSDPQYGAMPKGKIMADI